MKALLKIFVFITLLGILCWSHLYVTKISYKYGVMTGEELMFDEWMNACQKGAIMPINPSLMVICFEIKKL